MKIILAYKELELGTLEKYKTLFLWTPIEDNLKMFKEKYNLAYSTFLLEKKSTIYKVIPPYFDNYLLLLDRPDLNKEADIRENDDDFLKLAKISKMEFINDYKIKVY